MRAAAVRASPAQAISAGAEEDKPQTKNINSLRALREILCDGIIQYFPTMH